MLNGSVSNETAVGHTGVSVFLAENYYKFQGENIVCVPSGSLAVWFLRPQRLMDSEKERWQELCE
jgi:hypothetical protein